MILDQAAQVLELVRAATGGHTDADVTITRKSLALTRFANSIIHQNLAENTTTVRLRLHADGRTVTSTTTIASTTGSDELRELVARTTAAVAHAPADPGWPGLSPPTPLAGTTGYDQPTAHADPDQRAAQVRAFVDAAGGLATAGFCRTRHWTVTYANTNGQTVTGQTSEAALDGIARDRGADGLARAASTRLCDLDGAVLGQRAAAKARAGADPVELPPGRYEVVLEPPAVADLLQHLAYWGFNGKAFTEGSSFAEPGTNQFDPAITLVEDPFAGGSPGWAFDSEGTPTRRLVLVDTGLTTAVAHDRRTAAALGDGASSTGHALPDGAATGPFPAHPGLLPGPGGNGGYEQAGAIDPDAAGLVSTVERGLLVTDLYYSRPLDQRTMVVTGVTRNGVWLIEDGKVATPVRNLRYTQSYPDALGPGAVKGIGPTAPVLPAELITVAPCWVRAPALHLASWNFTGGASG